MKNRLLILLISFLMAFSSCFAEENAPSVIPTDAKLEYNHGIDCYKLGQYDEAVALFRTAIRLYLDYIDAYYNLGSLLEYLKQYDEALAIFEQIIVRNPKEYEALYKAAKLSAQLGDRTNAARYISMISKASPFYTKALNVVSQYHITPASGNVMGGNPPSNVSQSSGCYPNITSPTGITSDAIIKIQPNGKKMLFFKSSMLKGPISLTSDSIGNIYVANYNANNILKLSHSGACTVLSTNVSKPYGVHVNGNILFVACQGSNSVLRIKLK